MMKGIIRQSFKRQVFLITLSVTLVLVVLGGIATIRGFQVRLSADHMRTDIEQEKIITERIREMLDLSEKTLDSVVENSILTAVTEGKETNIRDTYAALYEATADIRKFGSVELYYGGKCKFTTAQGATLKNLPEDYGVLREASAHFEESVYFCDLTDFEDGGLIIARNIVKGKENGYVMVRIPESSIESVLSGAINAKDGFIFANRFLRPICLMGTAEDGRDLSLISENLLNKRLFDHGAVNNIYIQEVGQDLLCIYITPPTFEPSAVKTGYRIVFAMVVLSVVICMFVASRMSALVSKPLNTLYAGMKRFRKGDFDTKIEINRDDEFGQLAAGFNKMTSRLKETMNSRIEAEKRLNRARIEMMQAQLNPHFLYNTLDTIKWVAKANQVPEIATLSTSLAGLLRTGISGDQYITLEKELETVKNYCEIQKIRFDDSFELIIQVPSKLESLYVPKLILQPMVENSIIHGLEGRHDGVITISAVKDDEKNELLITITDNGSGISDEMIKALESDDPEALKGHLGINNVNTIIRICFGAGYGVKAERVEEGGTKICITLPVLNEAPEQE